MLVVASGPDGGGGPVEGGGGARGPSGEETTRLGTSGSMLSRVNK